MSDLDAKPLVPMLVLFLMMVLGGFLLGGVVLDDYHATDAGEVRK